MAALMTAGGLAIYVSSSETKSTGYIASGRQALYCAEAGLAAARVLLPGERATTSSLAGIGLGLLGVAIIFSEDLRRLGGERVLFASIVFMLSPIASAFGSVLVKRWGAGMHPVTLTAVAAAMTLIAALAAFGPARRASRVDPVVALRSE